ncbi:MAG: YggT family protein [Nocardioidaceae bacterium]|nr:YggT family protein [Nocardioidaceae bacterium]
MVVVGFIIELVLWFYILLILARIVADWVQMFARSWHPRGPILVLLEVIYTTTDPPIKAFRRVLPPLRFGGVAVDLSLLFVLIICYVLLYLNRRIFLVG